MESNGFWELLDPSTLKTIKLKKPELHQNLTGLTGVCKLKLKKKNRKKNSKIVVWITKGGKVFLD
jgi:hypothetical protein